MTQRTALIRVDCEHERRLSTEVYAAWAPDCPRTMKSRRDDQDQTW